MRWSALIAVAALAGCSGSPEKPSAPQTGVAEHAASRPAPSPPALTPLPQPTRDLSVLDNRDCRTVVQAYADALAQGDFEFAARVWDDPVIDGARLHALFDAYKQPTISIADITQEGAAGSSYCTVSGTLTDIADPSKKPATGEIVLKRVNDVPGATPQQLRWTIRSSTFVEEMQRTS